MSNKWKILLGVLIVSGIVFAAVETKFYGNINLQNNKVVNMGTPTSNSDGANKSYVDTQIHTRLNKQGGQLTGTLDMQTNYIVRLKKPRSGVNGKLDATPRDYVDGATNAVVNHAHAYTDTISTNLWKGVYQRLKLSGGTMTGNITMSSSSTVKGLPIAPDTDDTATSQGLARYYHTDAKQVAKDYYTAATNYANGKLSLSGGSMYGDISMDGHRITAMPDPQNDFDGANKRYVDNAINEGNAYQYFALKKGSGFTPFYALDSNTGRVFEVVICRAFRGAITSYYENIATTNSAIYSNVVRHWNVGETLRVPFKLAANTLSATNGTLVVKGGNGIVGNFGITTPPNSGVVYPFEMIADNEDYYPDTSINLYSEGLWSGTSFTFKLKNLTPNTTHVVVNFSEAKYYTSNTSYSSAYIEVNGTPQTLPCEVHLAFTADEEKTFTFDVLTYDVLYGLRWSFDIDMGYGNAYHFGQFFVPNGN